MPWRPGPFTLLGLLAAGVAAATAAAAWRRRERRDARRFVPLMGAAGGWSLVYAVQLGFTTLAGQLAAQRLARVLAAAVPTLWLLFCLGYAGRDRWLTRRTRALLAVEPTLYAALALTNARHGLVWEDAALVPTAAGPSLSLSFGPAYYAHLLYSYAAIAAGIGVLLVLYARASAAHRRQTGIVVLGVLPPFLANAAYALGLPGGPASAVDPTPFAFVLSGVVAGVGLYQFDLLERAPIARRRVLEEMGDGLVVLDADGRVVDMNSIARRTLAPPLAVGEPVTQLDTEGADTVAAALESLDGRTIAVGDGDDGRHYDVDRSTLTDHRGETVGHVLALRDVTDRAEYRRQSERLEEFASIVSHDLRSPLAVANVHLEMARGECDSDHLAEAEAALDRVEEIVEDTLTLARQGRVVDETEVVDLAGVVEDSWSNVATAAATLDLGDAPTVRADPERLRSLLENLFRNAVEHGGEAVTVRVGRLEGGFYVEDDGPGIPPGERSDVFESGYSTAEDGTGFGLAIVERVAAAHGWEVRATDGRDGGARFEVTGVDSPG